MGSKREKAEALFMEGYNCAQAVVGAFSDEIGMDINTSSRLISSFGGGMGRLREVCGAVSGMFFVLGCLYGYDRPGDNTVKMNHYKNVQGLAEKFREKNQYIVCRELLSLKVKKESPKPERRTPEYYKTRPCARLVGDAAEIMEEFINNN